MKVARDYQDHAIRLFYYDLHQQHTHICLNHTLTHICVQMSAVLFIYVPINYDSIHTINHTLHIMQHIYHNHTLTHIYLHTQQFSLGVIPTSPSLPYAPHHASFAGSSYKSHPPPYKSKKFGVSIHSSSSCC